VVERLALEPIEAHQPRGHGAGVGKDLSSLRKGSPVNLSNRFARAPVFGRRSEVAVGGAKLVVRLAVLMDEPDDLVGVQSGVARKARCDDGIHLPATGVFKVQSPPGERASNQIEAFAFDERHGHEVRLHAAPDELLGQPADVPLGAAVRERRLDREHEHAGSVQAEAGARAITA
jgi:hypothetical protein